MPQTEIPHYVVFNKTGRLAGVGMRQVCHFNRSEDRGCGARMVPGEIDAIWETFGLEADPVFGKAAFQAAIADTPPTRRRRGSGPAPTVGKVWWQVLKCPTPACATCMVIVWPEHPDAARLAAKPIERSSTIASKSPPPTGTRGHGNNPGFMG